MTKVDFLRTGRLILISVLLPLLFSACAQTRVVDSWSTDQPVTNKPDKVAVIAVLPEVLMRKAVEIDVAKILVKKGTPAVASSNLPGFSGGIRGEIDVEVATGLLRQADVDGIVVMFYSGGGQSEGYVRSDYWVEYLGSGMGYSWGRPYFTGMTDVYTIRQGPGYADFKTTAYVETSYYDIETELPVWRIVTFTKDVEHTDAARDIANEVASRMRSAGLKK
ncbi:MAG: hypothetical protein HKN57_12165 [Xanthomonadales bacterium]|nr:hypothetical protein [Gammaproteobacteria bacterium]MBT8053524.1 hypothetical protein [Gammaproteobacteria bacterium]NND57995.1 hypothetical protein [Xanthomonadales bacterium]NNK50839.1 hypothetical protein [Xanthomonadales bacterium]